MNGISNIVKIIIEIKMDLSTQKMIMIMAYMKIKTLMEIKYIKLIFMPTKLFSYPQIFTIK